MTLANKRVFLQVRLALTRSAPSHRLGPPPQPASLGRRAVALHIVPAVHVMHILKRAAVRSGAQSECVAAATAAAAVGGHSDVESSLALPVVDMKGSRRPFLVHERLGFIHGSS